MCAIKRTTSSNYLLTEETPFNAMGFKEASKESDCCTKIQTRMGVCQLGHRSQAAEAETNFSARSLPSTQLLQGSRRWSNIPSLPTHLFQSPVSLSVKTNADLNIRHSASPWLDSPLAKASLTIFLHLVLAKLGRGEEGRYLKHPNVFKTPHRKNWFNSVRVQSRISCWAFIPARSSPLGIWGILSVDRSWIAFLG